MEAELDDLRGRFVALEMLVTGIMTAEAALTMPEPVEGVKLRQREMFAGLQLLQRTTDPRSEAAWESTVETLNRVFANIVKRLEARG